MKVNEHLSILFFLSKKKASKDGKAPIWARITVDGERAEFSLCRKILPDHWDQERENVKISAHPDKKKALQLSSEILDHANGFIGVSSVGKGGRTSVVVGIRLIMLIVQRYFKINICERKIDVSSVRKIKRGNY